MLEKKWKVCRGSIRVGPGGSGTFASPPVLASRFNDIFLPRKMEFKGWVTDYKQCRYQGFADTELSGFTRDLQKMLPDHDQKCVDWDQTKENVADHLLSACGSGMTNLPKMVRMFNIIKKN